MVIGAGIVTAHAVPPAPQFSPAPATLPPVGGVIVSVYGGPVGGPPVDVNVAEHVFAASTWTAVVVLVPLHAPPQLVNAYPLAGAAVSVTGVALPNVTAQAAPPVPHVSPLPVTVPPVGTGAIVSEYVGVVDVNVAEHVFAASTWTAVVVLVPLHDPPQLVNAYPLAGAAVSVTGVALPNVTAQAAPPVPHVSPLPVTVPPVGTGAIVSE